MTSVLVLVEDVSVVDFVSTPACFLAAALAGDPSVDRRAGHDVELVSVHCRGRRRPVESPGPRVRLTWADQAVDVPESPRPTGLVPPGFPHPFTVADEVRLRSVLERARADVVVTTSTRLLAMASHLAPAASAVLHHVARLDPRDDQTRLLLSAFGSRAHVVTVLDEDAAHWVRDLLAPVAPTVVVVPHLLGPGWRPRAVPARAGEPGLIVARGPLLPDEQLPHVVEAFTSIEDRLPGWRLRIVGTGRRREELMTRIGKRRLFDRVEVLPALREARSDWARADIGVSAARLGGWHLPALDAMAAGVPFVAIDGGNGTHAVVAHEETGLLTVPDSVPSLATALLRLVDDPTLRGRLGETAHRVARDRAQAGLGAWHDAVAAALPRGRGPARETAGAAPSPEGHGTGPEPITPQQARSEVLALVAEAADRAAPGWFVIPQTWPAPVQVAIPAESREAFLEALGTPPAPTWLSALLPASGARDPRRTTRADALAHARRGMSPRLTLEPWPSVDDLHRSHLAEGATVEIDFWPEDVDGAHRAVREDSLLPRVPAAPALVRTPVAEVAVPVPRPFDRPTTWDVTFPIDAVYTWVDGSDPEWGQARARRLAGLGGSHADDERSTGQARFTNRDELRYSLRSLHLFAPWVRRVFVVTAGQRPEWLADHPLVRLVDHTEILPPAALPTFNSHAIESCLHRIEGLSEHFLYLNDDTMLTRPVGPGAFFTPGGSAAVFPSLASKLGLPTPGDAPYRQAAESVRALLMEEFGIVTVDELAHTPYPHRVSTLAELHERWPDAMERTMLAPFRSPTDVSPLSSLAQHWGLRTGVAHRGDIDFAYVNLADPSLRRKLLRLQRERDRDVLCIGDGHEFGGPPGWVDEELRAFLDDYFPVAAPWERP